jgi:hypothetical protein
MKVADGVMRAVDAERVENTTLLSELMPGPR